MATSGKAARPGARDPLIRFDNVRKRFGTVTAVDGVTLGIAEGELFALLGPSGCGKTTLLRMLAGFEAPDDGRVLLGGEDITAVPPHRRPVNMMFQNYALFPHLSVAGNIAFGLKQEGLDAADISRRVGEMLALVKLDGLGARRPDQLSGGQRQRVALARSLAKRPRVLLLDEPLAALDKKLRAETQFELMALQRNLGTTFVIVTHDQDEAMMLAGRIGVMNAGRLVQVGTPADLYERPNSRWVAEFVGGITLMPGRMTRRNALETAAGTFAVDAPDARQGAAVLLAIRPEKIRLTQKRPSSAANTVEGAIVDTGYLGDVWVVHARVAGDIVMTASMPSASGVTAPAPGERVWLSWPAAAGIVLEE